MSPYKLQADAHKMVEDGERLGLATFDYSEAAQNEAVEAVEEDHEEDTEASQVFIISNSVR